MTAADHSPTDAVESVEYHVPFPTLALSTAFFALVCAAFAYFAVAGRGPAIGGAVVGAVLFGYLVVRNVVRAVLRSPFAVLTGEGVRLLSGGHVSWNEIASVAVFPGASAVSRKGFIGIELHDSEAYLARVGFNRRRTARAGIARGLGPIRLPAEAFPVPMTEVVATMRRFHPGLVVNV